MAESPQGLGDHPRDALWGCGQVRSSLCVLFLGVSKKPFLLLPKYVIKINLGNQGKNVEGFVFFLGGGEGGGD